MTALGPQLPPEYAKTYQVLQPLATHYRDATCMEVSCTRLENGWLSAIDETTSLGQAQAYYIRHESGRRFTEYKATPKQVVGPNGIEVMEYEKAIGGLLTIFVFVPGQKCFEQHRVSLDRPAHFLIRDGHSGLNPRGTPPIIRNARDWVDDFANHQQALADKFNEG